MEVENQPTIQDQLNFLTQQMQKQANVIQEQQNTISVLQAKVRTSQNKSTKAAEPQAVQLVQNEQPREKLPMLDKFNGNRSIWDEWHLGAIHKLTKDGVVIGDDFDQFMYLYSRLEGDAVRMVSSTAKRLSDEKKGNGLEFLAYLNTVFGDPNKTVRAQQQLYNLKQGQKEAFTTFLPKFETVLANAGWSNYDDSQKVSLLRNALCPEMKSALVGKKQRSWSEFISKLLLINSDLNETSSHFKPFSPQQPKPSQQYSEMEWEPIQAKAAITSNKKRATWVTKEVLGYRKKNGLCVRCGNTGHISPKCILLPPLAPPAKVNSIEITEERKREILEMAQPDQIDEVSLGKEKLL